MKFAVIENGVVTNIAEADEDFAATQDGWIAADGADIGDNYAAGQFTKPWVAAPTRAQLASLIQGLLDAFALERDYRSIEAAITYDSPAEPNEVWAAEGRRCRVVRAQAWDWWATRPQFLPPPTTAEVNAAITKLLTWG